MQKIKISGGGNTFEFPWEWIERYGVIPDVNDLEAKAERGITTGYLERVRQAEIPQVKIKMIEELTQSQVVPIFEIIRAEKFQLTYFEIWTSSYKTIDVYAKKPSLKIKVIPKEETPNEILYKPFEITFTAYGGI